MVKNILELTKELKWLLTFFGISSAYGFTHIDEIIDYIHSYNIHIIFMVLFSFWLVVILTTKKIKELDDRHSEISNKIIMSVEEMHKDQLRENIKRLAKKLKNEEIIDDESTIKYIYDLEASLKKLSLNSYSQDALCSMKKRIKI